MPSKKPPKTAKRQPTDVVTHRFQSVLTRELVEELCKVHQEGQDFRNTTAIRCGVHPTLLTRWLRQGSETSEGGLQTELFMRFGKIEAEIRAAYIAEVSDPTASTEESQYDDGKVVGKIVTTRKTTGIQWLMERRFRQFRVEHIQKPDELQISEMLEPQQTVYTADMVLGILQQMAAYPERLPVAIRLLLSKTDWRVKDVIDAQAAH